MSSRYDLAAVFTLKRTMAPWFVLMSVAKPWMAELPNPLTSHSLGRLPVLVFSHATGLTTGGSHGPAAPAAGTSTAIRPSATPSTPVAAAATARLHGRTREPDPVADSRMFRRGYGVSFRMDTC